MIGQTISHYKITEKLGEGGMGVVYKAEDTKLERTVALKFLAAHLLNDDEAKQRFLREAKAAAALDHPNICHVYEIDEADGRTFISMAFVQGETLEDRIAKGPLPLKDALDIGRQVADGLEAAHEKGIVHRDIKPANILLDAKGRATIMDFGLARLTEASRLTKADTTMGTVAYMSPEQVQGLEVDHRSDIWALGCVLYEMVCGQKPFKGVYDKALLYEIVHQEPEPLTGLRTGVPMELEFIVGKCLAKDASDRYQSAREIPVDLRTLSEKLKSGRSTILRTANMPAGIPATVSAAQTVSPIQALPPDVLVVRRGSQRALQALAAVLTVALVGVLAVHFTESPPRAPEQPTRRFSFSQDGLSAASISPDGRYIAFVTAVNGESNLWLRALGSETARRIPGTEGARPVVSGWSPDSQAIVFATTTQIKRVSIDGGDPLALGELPGTGGLGFMGVTWSPDGERIVFSSAGGRLWEIPARGGEPQNLVDRDSGRAFWPHFLPTGAGPGALVYEAGSQIWVLNLETGEHKELGPGSAPVYSRDGYLIHGSGDTAEAGLRALPFSLATLETTGEAFPISEDGQFASVALDGTLVYLDGVGSSDVRTLVWRNRAGEILETAGQPQPDMGAPSLSPDGRRVAVSSTETGFVDIWIHDLVRSTKTRLTFDIGNERTPAWSPSGGEIVYWLAADAGRSRLLRKAADGTGEAVVLVEAEDFVLPAPDWSRDGRYLAYGKLGNVQTGYDIRYLQFETGGATSEPITFLGTPANEAVPKFSPDGRFLVYVSNETGRDEVYVRPFPDGAGKWQVSVNGGTQPRWRSDGRELYYVEDRRLMTVPVSAEQGLTLGRPQQLFESADLPSGRPTTNYDVSADGQRFLTITPVEDGDEEAPPKIRLVENWYAEFRDRERN